MIGCRVIILHNDSQLFRSSERAIANIIQFSLKHWLYLYVQNAQTPLTSLYPASDVFQSLCLLDYARTYYYFVLLVTCMLSIKQKKQQSVYLVTSNSFHLSFYLHSTVCANVSSLVSVACRLYSL